MGRFQRVSGRQESFLASLLTSFIHLSLLQLTLINRFRRDAFSYTSKQGLCETAREAHWLEIPGVARINHPRCYVLTKGGDTKTFLKEFGLTAAVSLLKWVVRANITGESKVVSESGKVQVRRDGIERRS